MNSEEIKLPIDDSYINVIHFGQGSEAVVIISGVSLTGLEGQGEAVAESYRLFAEKYSVYLFERKKVLKEGYTVEDMAEDIVQAMDVLHISASYIYGVSQGGMIAQVLAIKYPEKVKKLALCSTMSRPTATMKKVTENWLALAASQDVVALNRNFFQVVYSAAFLESVQALLPTLEKAGNAEDCVRFGILVNALLHFDVYQQLDQIKCPVLVIGDKNDQTIGIEGAYEIIDKLGCERDIYDQYSHAVYDEAPDIQEKLVTFFTGAH
ncbi:MAG: alpha/beta hydrolase [Peptococcaceae bacterium]|nr:alpha/beta hydrolase [Peptococcaceae bacterium]